MFSFFKKKEINVYAPVDGKVVLFDKLSDPTFFYMGKGVAIEPESTDFYYPLNNGILDFYYKTGHAYIFTKNQVQILVHIGIDTVLINNEKEEDEKLEAFEILGELKKPGNNDTLFARVDLDFISKFSKEGKHTQKVTPIVALEENLKNKKVEILVKQDQQVKKGDLLFVIK